MFAAFMREGGGFYTIMRKWRVRFGEASEACDRLSGAVEAVS